MDFSSLPFVPLPNSPNKTIDESLYSRQLYVLGHDAMRRMLSSSVLIIGVGGLGIEIAKNLALAGVHSLLLFDPTPVSMQDLGSQFYLTQKDIGLRRDQASLAHVRSLNVNVSVSVENDSPSSLKANCINNALLQKANVVILTEFIDYEEDLIGLDDRCASLKIHFIAACVRGLFGFIFCDFLKKFTILDANGELPLTGIYDHLTIDDDKGEIIVTCHEDSRHQLEEDDYIRLSPMKNDCPFDPFKITRVIGAYSFCIPLEPKLVDWINSRQGLPMVGEFAQVKMPKIIDFKRARSFLEDQKSSCDSFVVSDFTKEARSPLILLSFIGLGYFYNEHFRLPRPQSIEDALKFVEICKKLSITFGFSKNYELDENVMKQFAFGCTGIVPAICSIIGGLVAQEALKSISGKFHPIVQFFCFDAIECIPTEIEYSPTIQNTSSVGSRYDQQYAVFGKDFVDLMQSIGLFLVGTGAIGCELLKIWALMGLGLGTKKHPSSQPSASSSRSLITITDMDLIEKSNLNRQLLFRSSDIQQPKSIIAGKALEKLNPEYEQRPVVALQERVGPDSEGTFGREFFSGVDVVVNALDNVDARRYVDKRCVFYEKPLLESGTLGTKCNTQVVIPHLTESYSSSQDPPEKAIPVCTLKNFPSAPEHTIQWALDLFHGLFKNGPEIIMQYLEAGSFSAFKKKTSGNSMATTTSNLSTEVIEVLEDVFLTNKPTDFESCISWAYRLFLVSFHHTIAQLLFNFPQNAKTTNGADFWSGPKRCPDAICFSIDDQLHRDFVIAAARLRACSYSLLIPQDFCEWNQNWERAILATHVEPFVPKSGIYIKVSEEEKDRPRNDVDQMPPSVANKDDAVRDQKEKVEELLSREEMAISNIYLTPNPIEFEKDDDSNFHIAFISAAANLRALNYGIPVSDKHTIKGIAGKIIPAIATTTAFVAGLVTLELYKVAIYISSNSPQKDKGEAVSQFKNAFANLALPFFAFSEPILAGPLISNLDKLEIPADYDATLSSPSELSSSALISTKRPSEWTLWDRITVQKNAKLSTFVSFFERSFGLQMDMLSSKNSILYSPMMLMAKKEEESKRLDMTLPQLVEYITRNSVEPLESLVFEALFSDQNGNDVDIPFIVIHL